MTRHRIGKAGLAAALAAATATAANVADPNPAADAPAALRAGAARVEITPAYPIRLTGYVVRKTESEGVEQRLWAKALALAGATGEGVVVVTVDTCGLGTNVTEEVARRLQRRIGLRRECVAICSTHTHTGPWTIGFAPNIFAQNLPAGQMQTVERYTRELTDKLEQAAVEAWGKLEPARLSWARGTVNFAANRRTAGGPVDRDLSLLCARRADGTPLAFLVNYACHCTTLGGEFNRACGDWAGYAQAFMEQDFPQALALVSIGCGADANPQPRGGADGGLLYAKSHGHSLAAEAARLMAASLTNALSLPLARQKWIALPYQPHCSRADWEERAQRPGIVGYHARKNLERLDRGEALPTRQAYLVQAWTFGDRLAMVFLAGEVVVDYARRLKENHDPARLWVSAYANEVRGYIPSRRILREGGYEAEDSCWYYDLPAKFAPETEDLIVETVRALVPPAFRSAPGSP